MKFEMMTIDGNCLFDAFDRKSIKDEKACL